MKTTPDDLPAKGIATVRNVDHYGVSVPEMDQAIAFYTQALGADLLWRVGPFHETPTGAEIDQVEIAMLRLGPNLNVELLAIRALGQNRQVPATTDIGAAHLAFLVDVLEAAGASVAAHGGTMLGQPVNTAGEPKRGERIWYFKTPWGAFIELLWRPVHLPYEQETTARLYGAARAWKD
jgi:catechol 2,3-dioxygenase-like lactoylglutathione lyase family enzyme